MSFSRISVFLFEKETQRVLAYRLADTDLCCCKECPFANEQAWVKIQFTQSTFFNIELEDSLDSYDDYIKQFGTRILNVIKSKYYNTCDTCSWPGFLDFNRLKKIRIVVKQQVPWIICKKKQVESSYEIFTKSELEKFEKLTGLELL